MERPALRRRLLAERNAFVASPAFASARNALGVELRAALVRLEPECLGLYCAFGCEFNAAAALADDPAFDETARALPYARRTPRTMDYRRWDGATPTGVDECGIGASDGAVVVPDVIVVPCVGFAAGGFRLGYGGGYYDRWLGAHPEVVAVGVAWSLAELDAKAIVVERHDRALAFVVTERGVRC